MNVDLDALGRSVLQKLDRRMQRPPSQPKTRVAVQDDGVVVSNSHRILNFTGAGVSVLDDPTGRRTTIAVPGGVAFGRRTVLVSAAGAGFVLVSASTPANDGSGNTWRQIGYAHSGWAAPVAQTYNYTADNAAAVPPGATPVAPANGNAPQAQVFYLHHEFTLGASDLGDVILDWNLDQSGECYINDTLVGTDTNITAHSFFSLPLAAGLLVAGTNVIAIRTQNGPPGATSPTSAMYRLTCTEVGTPTMNATLGSDLLLTTVNTYFDILSVSLSPGTWDVTANIQFSVVAATAATVRLWDGSTTWSSGADVRRTNTDAGVISLKAIFTLSAPTTVKVSGAGSVASAVTIKAAAPFNGAGNNASQLNAIRIA